MKVFKCPKCDKEYSYYLKISAICECGEDLEVSESEGKEEFIKGVTQSNE